jgi:hypothetical protein
VALALRAFGIRCVVEAAHVSGLKLQLRYVTVQQDEALLPEQRAVREAQPFDLALWAACSWTQISDRIGAGRDSTRHTKLRGLLTGHEQGDRSGDPSHDPILADVSAEDSKRRRREEEH